MILFKSKSSKNADGIQSLAWTLMSLVQRMMSGEIDSPEFSKAFSEFVSAHKNGYWQEALVFGYRVRLAEELSDKQSNKKVDKALSEIIKGKAKSASKTEKIMSYLDEGHDNVGLGGNVEGYTIMPLEVLNRTFELLVDFLLDTNAPSDDEREFATEMYFRCLGEGYLFRLAEYIVQTAK